MIKHGGNFVKITLKQEDNLIVTEFINNVTEVTEENLDKLFDRFYTVGNSRSDKNTGLGLYITKILVERLGYFIDAKIEEENLIIRIVWE